MTPRFRRPFASSPGGGATWLGAAATFVAALVIQGCTAISAEALKPQKPLAIDECVYTFDSLSDSLAGMAALLPEKSGAAMSRFVSHVKGEIVFDYERSHESAVVTFRRIDLELSQDGSSSADAVRKIADGLQTPILVTLGNETHITGCRFAEAVSPEAQRLARFILSQVQSSRSGGGLGDWEVEEQDPLGVYTAKYTRTPNGLVKTIVSYGKPSPDAGAAPTQLAPSGSIHLTYVSGVLKSIKGQIDRVSTTGAHVVSSSHDSIALELVSQKSIELPANDARATLLGSVRGQTLAGLFVQANLAEDREHVETTALAGDTESSVMALLDQAVADSDPKADTTAVSLKLKALAYTHPEACANLGQRLDKEQPGSKAFLLIAGALTSAGTEAAQASLAELAKFWAANWDADSRLLPGFATLPQPSDAVVSCVQELSASSPNPGVKQMATMVLGGLAKNIRTASPTAAEKIESDFVARLKATADPADQKLLLSALGNVATPGAFEAVKPFLASPDVSIRSEAVDALRLVPGDEPQALLCQALASDATPNIRGEAALMFEFRTPNATSFAALKAALQSDKTESVRAAVVGALWKGREHYAEAISLIQAVAKHDPSKELRGAAQDLLNSAK